MTDQNRRQFTTTVFGAAASLAALSSTRLVFSQDAATPSLKLFFSAIRNGELERVGNFLERDPHLAHATEVGGLSAFAAALLARQPEISALIRERGYQPDVHESAAALDWERFEALAAEAPGVLNRNHPIGGTAMYAAALAGPGTGIFRVYSFGGDPSRSFEASPLGSPLQAALAFPHLPTAEVTAAMLLANGAEPNPPAGRAASPLHLAAQRGSRDMVEMLISKGADLQARDSAGRTAIESAESAGHRAVSDMLRRHQDIPREHSTSRRAYDPDGNPYRLPDLSAFSVRIQQRVVGLSHNNLDEVRALVERHPELSHCVATTTEGAVEAGAHMGRHDIVDLHLERGAPYSLITAIMRGDVKRVGELLDEEPARITERGAHDFALLWYPIIGKTDVTMMEELLRRGADIERQHYLGSTALHFAAVRDSLEMARLLIEKGADVNRVGRRFNEVGQTPLELAKGEVAKLLRDHGAKERNGS